MGKIFDNNAELSEWLDSNYWFEDGFMLNYTFDQKSNSISMLLAYQIDGTYEANTQRTLKVFSVKALAVINCTSLEEDEWSADHCMEGVNVTASDVVSFALYCPKFIEIECSRVIVNEEPNRVEVVKPWLSGTELFISVHGANLPSPGDWLSWFKTFGHDLGWRCYGGDLTDTAKVPQRSYDGWFLQETSQMSQTTQGLFFKHCSQSGNTFRVSFQRTELRDPVWQSLKEIVLRYKDIEISSGNCKFNNEQWAIKLDEKE
ncbi:MAG: hypothetical protein HRT35_07075 [Algicola sp.]|nr:hypothetical protein [Algicola sp.]